MLKLNINGGNPQMTKQMKQMSLYRRTSFNQKENIPLKVLFSSTECCNCQLAGAQDKNTVLHIYHALCAVDTVYNL